MTIASLVGFRWFDRGRRGGWDMRLSWAQVTGGFGLALALCLFEEGYSLHIHLGWPNIFIRLPLPRRWLREPYEMMESWGLSWFGRADIHLNWGRRSKILHMPWAWEFHRRSLLAEDGRSWIHELASHSRGSTLGRNTSIPIGYPPASERHFFLSDLPHWQSEMPYRYALRNFEIQERKATISVTEMEWRWRWFTWLAFPRMVRRSIDVKFSDEVGERAGSWKGGCVGCGYDMLPDETPQECLRRMERERRFD